MKQTLTVKIQHLVSSVPEPLWVQSGSRGIVPAKAGIPAKTMQALRFVAHMGSRLRGSDGPFAAYRANERRGSRGQTGAAARKEAF